MWRSCQSPETLEPTEEDTRHGSQEVYLAAATDDIIALPTTPNEDRPREVEVAPVHERVAIACGGSVCHCWSGPAFHGP